MFWMLVFLHSTYYDHYTPVVATAVVSFFLQRSSCLSVTVTVTVLVSVSVSVSLSLSLYTHTHTHTQCCISFESTLHAFSLISRHGT